jgi:hypothetical protein
MAYNHPRRPGREDLADLLKRRVRFLRGSVEVRLRGEFPEQDQRLESLFQALDEGIKDFKADTARVVKLLGPRRPGREDLADLLKRRVRFLRGSVEVRLRGEFLPVP